MTAHLACVCRQRRTGYHVHRLGHGGDGGRVWSFWRSLPLHPGILPHQLQVSVGLPHQLQVSVGLPHQLQVSVGLPHQLQVSVGLPHQLQVSVGLPHQLQVSVGLPHQLQVSGGLPHQLQVSGGLVVAACCIKQQIGVFVVVV